MKRLSYLIVILFISSFLLFGCQLNQSNIDYSIDLSNINSDINTNNFDISLIKLNVIEDGKEQVISLDKSMLSDEDYNKLFTAGTHNIEINYKGIKKNCSIKINGVYYLISFTDYNGDIIDQQTILEGEDAFAPEYEDFDNYMFIGFSSDKYKNVSEDVIIHPVYVKKYLTVTFMVNNEVYEELTVLRGTILNDLPQVPNIEGFTIRWLIDENYEVLDDVVINSELIGDVENLFNNASEYLEDKYNNLTVNEDLELETNWNVVSISWESNSDCLSKEGKYKRPYKPTNFTLTYTLSFNNEIFVGELNLNSNGYKDLSNGIAAGYVYRNYGDLNEEFFETIDVIYCAFITFYSSGSFKSNSITLNYIEDIVLPMARKHGVYVVISLGGGGAEPKETFQGVSSTAEKRAYFVSNVIDLVNEYGLDGVDIDWETPTYSERTNFTLLAKDLYEGIKANNPNHLVTAAIAGGTWQPPNYDLSNSSKYLDYINVMTYEMTNNSGYYQNALYPTNGYYDKVYNVGNTLNSCSIDESVDIYNGYGVPNEKLIFGLAFYGIKQIKSNGVFSKSSSVTYTELKSSYLNNSNYNYVYDERAGVPYLLSKDGTEFISFEDKKSIIEKCEYMFNNNCAGVMYWENGCDSTGDLVNAIKIGMKK